MSPCFMWESPLQNVGWGCFEEAVPLVSPDMAIANRHCERNAVKRSNLICFTDQSCHCGSVKYEIASAPINRSLVPKASLWGNDCFLALKHQSTERTTPMNGASQDPGSESGMTKTGRCKTDPYIPATSNQLLENRQPLHRTPHLRFHLD